MSSFDDIPLPTWPDPLTDALMTARPNSGLFQELVALAMRLELDKPDGFFAAADVGTVMEEAAVSIPDLADRIRVPPSYMHAVARGWHRLGIWGLALVAEALDVPLSAFFFDSEGNQRLEVCRYHAYRVVAPRVTILGGET